MKTTIVESMEAAILTAKGSNYRNPLIGFEFSNSGYGDRVKLLTLRLSELSYKTIYDFLSNAYGSFSFSRIQLLENKEWEEGSYGFDILNTWGKISKIIIDDKIKKDGQYVIVNRAINTTTEVELYNTHPWVEYSKLSLQRDSKELLKKIGECGKASDLEVIYIPEFHIWKVESWDTYPDDPGCGIYSIGVRVFDKATNKEYSA